MTLTAALPLDGQLTVSRADADDGSYVSRGSLVYGTFTLDDGGPDWLRSGLEAQLVGSGQYRPASDGRAGYLNGGLFAMEGAFPDVLFDDLLLVDAAAGGACPTEPGGRPVAPPRRSPGWSSASRRPRPTSPWCSPTPSPTRRAPASPGEAPSRPTAPAPSP